MSQDQKSGICLTGKRWIVLMSMALSLIFLTMPLYAAKPVNPGGGATCTISTTPNPAVIDEGQSIEYSGSVSGKGPAIYSWTFTGVDSVPATTQLVTISYVNEGSFSATLNGENGKGNTCTATTIITVNSGDVVNIPPVAVDDDYSTTTAEQLSINAPGVLANDYDEDDDTITAVLKTGTTVEGSIFSLSSDGSFEYTPPANFTGSDSFTYTADDGTDSSLVATVNINVAVSNEPAFSINSTSRNQAAPATTSVAQQPLITGQGYQILAINDLGMHCGDLDTRISSILPPFNVIHSQVVERATATTKPRIMNEGEVILTYSAVSNSEDPILATAPVLAKDKFTLYKTNFWDIARDAYGPFYPSGILDAFYPAGDIVDVGLPVPDVERFYLGDGELHAGQQAMPGLDSALNVNDPKEFHEHIGTLPFFINFPFGYTSDLNIFEAAGIPMAVYDDSGRKNPYPLMRVQAEVDQQVDGNGELVAGTGTTVATVDTVVPISGEAECQRCHAEQEFDGGNGRGIKTLIDDGITPVAAFDDTADNVPLEASIEWASDKNILKVHDLKHGTALIIGTTEDFPTPGSTPFKATVCQTCHYTPALDLAQFGPLGPENDNVEAIVLPNMTLDAYTLANGRDQVKHKTMSNVMHSHHGQFTDLFPPMPPAVDAEGVKRPASVTKTILGQTCYACHPGEKTECMRGAMANGGQVCQDCHGNMNQVGDDFSRNVSPTNIGDFELAADFYDHQSTTPRVPWANEPGCGSCHTGSATDNLTADNNTLVNPTDSAGNVDGIRLAQAFRTDDDKATPIVPVNKMFAENVVAEGAAADGNPKLYRVSTGHGGLFCESCHGATHAEWPNANPAANDNVASTQIQGHNGTIIECATCHEPTDESLPLGNNGPHGMHPVSDRYVKINPETLAILDDDHGNVLPDPNYLTFTEDLRWNTDHKSYKNDGPGCNSCHGADLKGTVLSRTAKHRVIKCKDDKGSLPGCAAGDEYAVIPKGTPVGCGLCHQQKKR